MRSVRATARDWRLRLAAALPQGEPLPESVWRQRHRRIVSLLWVVTSLLVTFALFRGESLLHGLLEAVPLVALAAFAGRRNVSRRFGATAASLGLITACAVLVHLWDGRIEAHFSFFVMLGVLVLYQDWVPYLIAIGYVVVHHTLLGVIASTSVYDHAGAQREPWLWALIHGAFVLAASAASVVSWRANEQLLQARQDARTDDLTGLLNRRGLYAEVERAMDGTTERSVALLLLDLDRFKDVNDTLGHHAGDDLLRQVAARLRATLSTRATLGRLGGDEFVVLLEGGSSEAAVEMAFAARAALEVPFTLDGLLANVQASVGIACSPDHGATREVLLRHADVAMYRAKVQGSGVEVYEPEDDGHCRRRLQLAGELQAALADDQLVIHYQPQADMRTGRINAVEALVRWQHPNEGLLYPDAFLAVAGQHGLMRLLTLKVLDQVLQHQEAWRRSGLNLRVAVNLAPANLLDARFPDDVEELLRRRQLPATVLRLEISEDTVTTDTRRALDVLARLGELGIQLSLDDYGTGSSSLGHLKRLPVTELKIDKSFVINMLADPSDAIIVRSTVDLVRQLGLHVVAEGVETEQHWNLLRDWGCHTAQGYHLARPLPVDELVPWLRRFDPHAFSTASKASNAAPGPSHPAHH